MLVPHRPEMAHRIGGTHQRRKTATWPPPLPLQRLSRNARWVGLGVIADNLVNIGRAMEKAGGSLGRHASSSLYAPPAARPCRPALL